MYHIQSKTRELRKHVSVYPAPLSFELEPFVCAVSSGLSLIPPLLSYYRKLVILACQLGIHTLVRTPEPAQLLKPKNALPSSLDLSVPVPVRIFQLIAMATKFKKEASPQEQSLLLRLPGEMRNLIFELTLAEYVDEQKPFEKNTHYCRPESRYAGRRTDTALLSTCQLVYGETYMIQRQDYVHVDWCYVPNRFPLQTGMKRKFCSWMTSLHIFADQYWLESASWREYAKKHTDAIRNVKITIRYCDWATGDTPMLDAKQEGAVLPAPYRSAADDFHKQSWGRQFVFFKALEKLELELEIIERYREENDETVTRAVGWRFPLHGAKVLVCKPEKTTKTGWYGTKLGKYQPSAR